jgi:hypothetical protein
MAADEACEARYEVVFGHLKKIECSGGPQSQAHDRLA